MSKKSEKEAIPWIEITFRDLQIASGMVTGGKLNHRCQK